MGLTYKPPKRSVGPRAKANERMRRKVWPAVLGRARYRCENCQAEGVQLVGHHVAGRPGSGLCLGPWANCEELLTALCVGCRGLIHADQVTADRMRSAAAARLSVRVYRSVPIRIFFSPEKGDSAWRVDSEADPSDEIRRFVRLLEDAEIEP